MAAKPHKPSKSVLKGALILSISGIIVKVLSAVYRVPFQNIVGDIGFYIYQQVYPFYGIVLTISMLGFPLIISKLIAEKEFSQKDVLIASFLMLSVIGLMMFSGLFLGAHWIANQMGDLRLTGLLKVISFYYLLMPFSAVLRGYFQGHQNMVPTAISQVLEQFVRVAIILVLTPILILRGYNLYDAGMGAVFGSIMGGVVGLLLLLSFYIRRKEWRGFIHIKLHMIQFPLIIRALLFQGFAFCLSSLILVLFQLIDSLHLYSLLRQSGIDELTAKEWKGVYDRGQPLLQLGTIVANSLSLVLVPLISNYVKKNMGQELISKVSLSLRISLAIGTAASVGLISIIEPINRMLFTDTNGSGTLAIFVMTIVFSSLIMTITAVIQSLGHYVAPIFIVAAGMLTKWWLDLWLIPRFDIDGAAVSTVVAFLEMTICFYLVLRNHLQQSFFCKKDVWIVLRSALFMAIILGIFNTLLEWIYPGESRLAATFQAFLEVGLGAFVFIVSILKTNLFKQEEIVLLPFGYLFVRKNDWRRREKHG